MRIFKPLLISLFLAYPLLSMADVTVVACNQNIKIDSKVGICLPTTRSVLKNLFCDSKTGCPDDDFTNDSNLWSNFIYGRGNSFSEAWDDAQAACKSMITIIDQNGNSVLGQQTEKQICNLQECVAIAPPKGMWKDTMAIGTCVCRQTGYSSKAQKTPLSFDCNGKARGTVSGKVNFKELYDAGQEICRQEAIRQQDSFSTYCFIAK